MLLQLLKGLPFVILGALIMFGVDAWRNEGAINAAVKGETAKQVEICNGRVASAVNEINAASDALLDKAIEGERALGRTPIDQAELQDVCNVDGTCRDQQKAAKK